MKQHKEGELYKKSFHFLRELNPVHRILELEETGAIMGQAPHPFYVWMKQSPENQDAAYTDSAGPLNGLKVEMLYPHLTQFVGALVGVSAPLLALNQSRTLV